jgi:tetratricopeptide (TPR) repeat protein
MPEAHFNLGALYEKRYEYDKATAEYQETIAINPSHVKAHANLSRLLILANQPLSALRVAVDGTKIASNDARTTATLRKDLAWAEDQLGFYSDAEAEAKSALQSADVAPSAYCVLGKIYTHWGKVPEARQAWKSFTASINDPKIHPPIIEPDCTRLAEAASNEKK